MPELHPRGDLLVLCYHAVSVAWGAPLAVTPQQLEAQLRLLASRGYRGVRFSAGVLGSDRGRRVAVTFDDGYRSVLALAKPILDRLGWPATLYVPTDHIGTERPMSWPGIESWVGGPFENELMPLSWEEVRELQAAGWEIGSHTCSHPHLTTLADRDLRHELITPREVCERELGEACLSIAYPYGDDDDRVIAAAAAAGYRTGAALAERSHAARELHWPRVGIYRSDSEAHFRRRVSRSVRVLDRTPAVRLARWGVASLTSPLRPAGEIEGITPAISLLASHGILIRGRAAAAATGLAGRLGVSRIHVLWPEANSPQLVTSPAAPHTVDWMTRRFEPTEHRRDKSHAAMWAVLRARAAFIGHGTGRAVELAEAALGHTLNDPHLAIFRASDDRWVKAIVFVWHGGAKEPAVVVKLMPYQRNAYHVRHETDVVALLRKQLAGSAMAATLPPAPLLVLDGDDGYAVVEPVDPLGGQQRRPDRGRALAWLRAFHAATERRRPWGLEDEETVLASTRRTWGDASLDDENALCERIGAGLVALRGAPVPLVTEHRDFWAGNISATADELRVYAWEWTRFEGRPFFDLWTYELADARSSESAGLAGDVVMLNRSLTRVEEELVLRGIDPAFARLTLPSVLGEITFRGDWATGDRFDKRRSVQIMQAAAQLLLVG